MQRGWLPLRLTPLLALTVSLATTLAVSLESVPGLFAGEAEALLPDIIVRPSDLYDRGIRTDVVPGRRHLSFSNGTANIGRGTLYLYGALPANPDGTQRVVQRVYHADGTFFDRDAGLFVYHPRHDHVHVEDWCRYRLREVLPGDAVGEVVAGGEKVSFCILDLAVYDARLPSFRRTPQFTSCSTTIQGLSVGWIDVYGKNLPGQNIDITAVPDGHYWLESEADPDDHVLESDEGNNIARIKITLGNPPDAPDLYEPNDGPASLSGRPPGGPNSPDLGPCNPKRILRGLNIHQSRNDDYYKFYIPETGGSRHLVRIDFRNGQGNLDLGVLDDGEREVGISAGDTDVEVVSLEGLAAGAYYARVAGRNGARSHDYTLTVIPSQNGAPWVSVLSPPAGDARILRGAELYFVRWSHADPEGNPCWVSVHLNTQRGFDGGELLLPTALNTDAGVGFAAINSAEVPPGSYWIYCSITDGGTTAGAWSEGTITFIAPDPECHVEGGGGPDCNHNSVLDGCEIALGLHPDCNLNDAPDECDLGDGTSSDLDRNGVPDECERPVFHRGDANENQATDISDVIHLLGFLFLGNPSSLACREAADADNDGKIDISDGIYALEWLFLGGPAPAPPGPTGTPCGPDPDPPGSPRDLGCESYGPCA